MHRRLPVFLLKNHRILGRTQKLSSRFYNRGTSRLFLTNFKQNLLNHQKSLNTNLSFFVSNIERRTMTTVAVSDKFTRLPEVVKPTLYKIYLKPDLVTFKYEGNETITLNVVKPTDFLKLHASEIEIKKISVELADGNILKDLPVEMDRKWMTMTIKLPKTIDQQEIKLLIDFVAEHNNKMHGFYRSSYKDVNGKEKHLVSTQFESTYARVAFPCWDEPIYKAKFDIILEVDEKLTALSNMNVVNEEVKNGKKIVKYGITPSMSSYLVAFAVGEFEYLEKKTKSGVPVRVYTVEGKKKLGDYSLNLAVKALDFYDEWFDIKSPLPKVDMIAVPDFSMGAMENWGLVTYREVALLIDPAKTSTRSSMYASLVVAHELAHFWFGNLATMKWWDNLWLKEGFASFMEYLFVSKYCPEFDIWVHFVNDEWSRGMSLDCLRSSHPIEVPIDNPNELDEIYDSITYAKSNSIIRMLYEYLTEEVFQKGLRLYLKKFQYGNAETQDLWNCFSETSGKDIGKMMSTFTRQMGFPLVTVEQKIDGTKRILKLSQTRFLADGGKDETNPLWHVPFNVSSASNPNQVVYRGLLTASEQEFVIENIKEGDWIKVNAGTAGFFRVRYSEEMLKSLLPAIEKKTLPVLDRFGIANDLYALVEAGKVPASQFLSLVAVNSNEDEYIVWGALDGGIGHLSNILSRHEDLTLKKRFDQFITKVYEPVFKRYGWEPIPNEPLKDSLLRGLIIGRLSRAIHQPIIDVAHEKFNDHLEKKTELHPDLRGVIYGTISRNYGKDGVEKLRQIFETVGFPEIERNCISAMGQSTDEKVLTEIFDYGVVQGKIRPQDLFALFGSSGSHKVGQDVAWNFYKNNVKLLLEKFGSPNSALFQHCLKAVSESHCDPHFAQVFEKHCKEVFDEDALKVLDRPIRQSVESIHLNADLLKRSAPSVTEYLTKNGF